MYFTQLSHVKNSSDGESCGPISHYTDNTDILAGEYGKED